MNKLCCAGAFFILLSLGATAREPARPLQELIASAPPGATLHVPEGLHYGPIVIDKPLTLLGDHKAVLDGRGQGTIVHITAPDVTVKGFIIRNSGRSLAHEDSAILVEGAHTVIEENELTDVLFGIYLKNAPGSYIRRNKVTGLAVPEADRGDAIRLWYSADVSIEENETRDARDVIVWYSPRVVLRKNRLERGRYGIHYMYTQETIAEGNVLIGNFVGIYAMYSQKVTLRHNLFVGHRGPSGYGIGLKDVDDAQIEENVIADNSVGVFIDNSPSSLETFVLFQKNLFAYNETAVTMLPSVRGDVFTENSFIDNLEQVRIAGGGQLEGNFWSWNGHGNYWSDYLGYDEDGNGVGDLVYRAERLFENLMDQHPQLRLFLYSPSVQAIDFAAQALPIVKPQPKLIDSHPLMAPVLPENSRLNHASVGAQRTMPFQLIAVGLLLFAVGAIFAFTRARRLDLAPPSLIGLSLQGGEPVCSPSEEGCEKPLIVVQNMTKRFGPVTAVENLSFTIKAGEAVALWGANGAGKTTVLHCLLGLLNYEGTIELSGYDLRRYAQRARRLIGFVPQEIHLSEDLSVRETLVFVARLKKASLEAIPTIMEQLDLLEHSNKAVRALSGGTKQRLALALALLGNPTILLLDEPTASLDAQTREDFLRLLVELKNSGTTMIFSSHRQDEISVLADRVLVLEQGQLVRSVSALYPLPPRKREGVRVCEVF